MIQSDQLGDFKESTKQRFEQITAEGEKENLFIHKVGFPNVMVRAPKAYKKIHCWRLKTLEITQYADQNGAREKAVAVIQFDGELIFTLLDLFNQMMSRQILEYVENITEELRTWCDAPIKNVFVVKERTDESLGFKHGFLQVTPQLFYIDKSHYFEYRCWVGDKESQVYEIQQAEQVEGTSSYTGIFQYICQVNSAYKKLKKLAIEKKKKQAFIQQKKRQIEIREKSVQFNNSNYGSEMPSNWNSRQIEFDQ